MDRAFCCSVRSLGSVGLSLPVPFVVDVKTVLLLDEQGWGSPSAQVTTSSVLSTNCHISAWVVSKINFSLSVLALSLRSSVS